MIRAVRLGHDQLTTNELDRVVLDYAQADESGIFDALRMQLLG